MPSTVASSSTLAAATPRRPPKRAAASARFLAPMPAISSSLRRRAGPSLARARMPVIAKRCASSRICATSISAAESLPSSSFSRPSAKTSFSRPTLRPSPFSTPTIREMSRPSSANTSRAIDTWPRPPSTSTRSGNAAGAIDSPRRRRGVRFVAPSPAASPPVSSVPAPPLSSPPAVSSATSGRRRRVVRDDAFAGVRGLAVELEIGRGRVDGVRVARRLDELRVAPRQHLAHRRVVVARRDAGDVVAAVLRVLHLVVIEDHARRLRRLAGRVADVEALDAQRVEVVLLGARSSASASARVRSLLRAFLGQQPRRARASAPFSHISSQMRRCSRGWCMQR